MNLIIISRRQLPIFPHATHKRVKIAGYIADFFQSIMIGYPLNLFLHCPFSVINFSWSYIIMLRLKNYYHQVEKGWNLFLKEMLFPWSKTCKKKSLLWPAIFFNTEYVHNCQFILRHISLSYHKLVSTSFAPHTHSAHTFIAKCIHFVAKELRVICLNKLTNAVE